MRKTQTTWRRCWSQKWLRKFIAISLAVATTICGVTVSNGWAAGSSKKPPRTKAAEKTTRPTEKMARKIEEAEGKTTATLKELPKTVADNHPLKPCVVKAEESLQAVKAIKDYSAVLFKQEMVQNKLLTQTMFSKFRHEPFSVYLKFEQPHAGREVIYVDGLNKGRLMGHDAGIRSLAGTVNYIPTSKEAMAENRYPITQAGMAKMVEAVIVQWQAAAQYQEIVVKDFANVKVGEESCLMLETIHPQPREHFKFHKTRLYLHTVTKLPIRVEQYGWPEKEGGEPVLMEEYTYTQIKTNLGLTDIDFDKTNKAYQF
ncbi:MAG: hypothetical protein JWN70_3673 [Planctomycetaceae bacterium]|nr:hypothetical protein [Planctomycetaceae bacterium]